MRALDPRLLRRTRAARPLLALDVVLGVLTALAVLAQATLLARIVALAFAGVPLSSLRLDLGLLVAAFVLRGACAWGMEVAGRRAAWDILSELRMALVGKRLQSAASSPGGTEAAEVLTTAVHGVDALEAYFARYLPQALLAVLVPPLVIAWAAVVDLEAAVIMALTLPLVPVFMWLIGRFTERRTQERWDALRALSTHFLDVVRGLPTLRAFGRARRQVETLELVGDRYRAATMETLRVSFLSGSVLELAATLGVALVAVATGLRLVSGTLGLEAGLTVLVLAPELYLPFRRLGAEYHASADGLAVAERMFELLDAPPSARPSGLRPPPTPARATLCLEAVAFSYPSRPGRVLDEVNLELAPGETVALVGESGSGKTTIVTLILGLLEPTAGRISIGGVDLAACDPQAWRRLVAWAPQHPTLFRGSVAENIRLGDPQASAAQVAEAAVLAGAHAFIRALPNGYDTAIGEGGRPLSPGERRRIGLARAFLRDAPLLLLDEPTADLDPRSVEAVSTAVRRLQSQRTILVVAHRAELVQLAHRVVRLVGGTTGAAAGTRRAA